MKIEFSTNLKQALRGASQDVAYDLYESDPDAGTDPVCVAECCLNHLSMGFHKGDKEAGEEVTRLVREFDYAAVLKEAANHVDVY